MFLYIIFKGAMLPVNATLQEIQVLMLASLYNTYIIRTVYVMSDRLERKRQNAGAWSLTSYTIRLAVTIFYVVLCYVI